MRPATASLLQQCRAERRFGHSAQAAATLERAVRIDPDEPAVWLELARLRRDDGNWAQAEQLARKAQTLAAADSEIAALASELINDAQAMQGQNADIP